MQAAAARTYTYKVKCQENSTLHDLLQEKRQEYEEEGKENLVRAFANAAKSIRNHPVPITTKGQFAEVKHVGPFVLKKVGGHFAQGAEAGNGQGHGPEEGPPAKKRKTAPYVPKLNSAPYALLITMYRALAEGKDEYRRDELIQDADNSGLSEKTIALDPLNGQAGRRTTHTNQDYYSGWTSMSKQLIAKGLVLKQGNPPKYILTEYGEETARECLQRSNLADPLPAGPAGAAPRPTPAPGPRPPAGPPPPAAPKNARAAAAAAAEARMARNADAGGAGPSTAAAGGSRPDRRRDAVDTAGNRQQKGGAAGAGGAGAAGFRGLVAERPDLQRMGAEREPNEADGGHEEEGGTESDFEELDGWPAASPTDAVPVIGDDVVQKLVSLGFSPGQARTALHATHVADLPDSPLVEQAANWLLENDSTDRPAQPQSPVRPSFQARMATAEPREKRTGTVNGAAAPRAAVRERQGRPGSAAGGQGAARAPGRPPTAPTQRAAPARTAGQSGAGPSGTADRRDAGRPVTLRRGGVQPRSSDDCRQSKLLKERRFSLKRQPSPTKTSVLALDARRAFPVVVPWVTVIGPSLLARRRPQVSAFPRLLISSAMPSCQIKHSPVALFGRVSMILLVNLPQPLPFNAVLQ